MNKITYKDWNKIFRKKIKEQGYEKTLVAISWNILEIKQEMENMKKGK